MAPKDEEKAKRLAAALRDNLRKRKAKAAPPSSSPKPSQFSQEDL